ncbi:MAG: mannose-6-phosphate isomerase, class I [Desulfobacteraceae bacterium]|nr:mannose-6-phosphate isomerase, class I [Desulfobacteraceae bacterium]
MTGICLLENTIQEYAWGSYTAIPELLGSDSPANTPQAELWMGAHPKAPSKVKCNGTWRSLLELIDKNSQDILGGKVAKKFKNRLPYLFKVLAAAKPLSIQAHPSLDQASEGFERENRLGIPLDAPNRNYKDDNHKPECICALTFFWALNGFRKIPDMISLMDKICPPGLKKDFDLFRQQPNSRGLKDFFKAMMIMNRTTQKRIINDAVKEADQLKDKNNAYQWMIDLHEEYPSDIGILSPIILNLICLEPGQAMFLPAGTLHAYLDGVGIELMANSDNVLRGGLTPKHVDVKELLNVLDFEEREINILNMERINPCEQRYESHAEEFALSVLTVKTDMNYYSPDKRCVEILFCTDGDAVVVDLAENNSVDIKKGMSILIPAVVKKYSIKGDAVLYKAAVPI